MYLLDTNVFSELRKRDRCAPAVARWYAAIPADSVYLSVIVVGELRRGVELVRRRDAAAATALDRWLSRLIADYADRILPIGVEVAEVWGRINVPNPLPPFDGLLAATAIAHELVLVTRNTRDVEPSGASLLNPWLHAG